MPIPSSIALRRLFSFGVLAAGLLVAAPAIHAQTPMQFPRVPMPPCTNPSGYTDYGTTADFDALELDVEAPISDPNQAQYQTDVANGMKDRNNYDGCTDTSYTYNTKYNGVDGPGPRLPGHRHQLEQQPGRLHLHVWPAALALP